MNEHSAFRMQTHQQAALLTSGIADIFRRRYRLAIGVTLLVMAMSFVALRVLPSRYEAAAILWLRPAFSVGQQESAPETRLSERQQSIVQELRSTGLAIRIVRAMNLHASPEFEAALPDRPQGWQRLLRLTIGDRAATAFEAILSPRKVIVDLTPEERDSVRDRALANFFLKNFAVSVEGTERLKITYRSDNPRFAYEVLRGALREFEASQIEAKAERSNQATTLLKHRIEFLRKRIDEPSRVLLQADNVKLVELQNEADIIKPDAIVSVPPSVPTLPILPPLRLVFALSLVGGLFIALLIIAFLELRRWVRLGVTQPADRRM